MRVHRGQAVAGDEPRGPGLRLGLTGRCRTVCHHPQKALEHGWLKGRMRAGGSLGLGSAGWLGRQEGPGPGSPLLPPLSLPMWEEGQSGSPQLETLA